MERIPKKHRSLKRAPGKEEVIKSKKQSLENSSIQRSQSVYCFLKKKLDFTNNNAGSQNIYKINVTSIIFQV